jgi:hypothetical protein
MAAVGEQQIPNPHDENHRDRTTIRATSGKTTA